MKNFVKGKIYIRVYSGLIRECLRRLIVCYHIVISCIYFSIHSIVHVLQKPFRLSPIYQAAPKPTSPCALILYAATLLIVCSSCVNIGDSTRTSGLGAIGLPSFLTSNQPEKLYYPMVRAGTAFLEEGNYAAASKAFGRALKFDPQEANLHFLNALSYHLAAEAGDSSQYEMSEVGYKIALQFDSGRYMAAYHLGIIKMYQRRYREAQDNFAYALLFDAKNTDILLGLATASYYAQDLKTSVSTIESALKLSPDDPYTLRASIMIYAAIGDTVYASNQLEKYRNSSGPDNYTLDRLSQRLKDWQRFHKQNPYVRLADTSDVIGSDASNEGLGAGGGDDSDDDSSDDSSSDKSSAASKPKMVLVDVVIIRSQESVIKGKGVNFLNGLGIIFGGNGFTYEKDNGTTKGEASTSARSISKQFFIKLPGDNRDEIIGTAPI